MRKIFYILFLFFLYFTSTFADDDIKIISRSEWGADESYRYLDSPEWQDILEKRRIQAEKNKDIVYTKEQLAAMKAKQDKEKKMEEILFSDFGNEIEVKETIYTENGRKLAWPVQKSKKINGIVIHHTYTDYENSVEGVRQIYKYHTLGRQWGDIGYNFLIGKNGEIYEGRAGGDYVVAAHDKWNNFSTIGIAIIGDYTKNPISREQYNSLRKLSSHLVKKYDIDLTQQTYFHKECIGENCEIPLISDKRDKIIGHRDAGHTSCPGEELYKQITDLKEDLLKQPFTLAKIKEKKIFEKLEKIPDQKLIDLLAKVESDLDKKQTTIKLKAKSLILSYFKYKNSKKVLALEKNNNTISIKLSYPDKDKIKIRSGTAIFDITRKGNDVYIKGKKYNVLKIPKKNPNSILEIVSWERIPAWDKNYRYNDNKFRGDLTVYAKNDELVVVNTLNIEDYLKGLGEVSNSETPEKIKTIIIAARTYATYYITKSRKFPGELYDGVDNSDIFQRYLGYGLESRSPNISKIVEETKGQLITYNGELIKPWYFSSSDGNTLSFYEYCSIRYSDEICLKESKKYPYLQSVVDQGSKGKTKAGHGVGISGAGAKYFAEKGWSFDMIIKYFLKGVEVF